MKGLTKQGRTLETYVSKNQPETKLTVPIIAVGTLLLIAVLITFICNWLLQSLPQDFANDFFGNRSGDRLFRTFLLDPIPNSVTILHSQDDQGFGDYILLHFKLSPDDFKLVLASKKWEISSFVPISGYYTEEPKDLSWWNLRSLGKNAIHYHVVIEYNDENIWVNSQKNDVYFKVIFVN